MPVPIVESDSARLPILFRYRSSKWFIGIASFIATFTDGVLYSIVVPLLPFTLEERSGVSPDKVQSWIMVLFIVFGCSMILGAPIAAWVTQHSQLRQVPLVIGLLAALAGTLLFMLAKATYMLVLARCLQGVSAGVVYTTVLALLVESVDRDEVGSWIGFALSGVNLGVLLAPAFSGVIYEKAGYYPVFAICLAIIAFDLIVALLLIDKKRAQKCLLAQHTSNGWKHSGIEENGSDDSGYRIPATAGGKRNDDRPYSNSEDDERLPLLVNGSSTAEKSQRWFSTTRALLSSPQILAALYSSFVHSTLHTSFDAVLPRFVQQTFHWNSSGAGLVFLTLTVPAVMSPLYGFLSDRYGRRRVALGGFALAGPSLALLGLVQTEEAAHKFLLCIFLVLIGIGINLFLTSLVTDMSFAVERLEDENPQFSEHGGAFTEAYALIDCTFGAGAVFGPLIGGLLYEHFTWAITYGALAALCLSGSVPVMLYTGVLSSKAS